MLLAHPAGIKADQRVERSLYQRAVGYTFERPIRRSSENQTNGRSAIGLKVKESSLNEAARAEL
jgi:hypothetical protein